MNHANDNHTGLRFLSVCSGIEAASVAWHPLGWKAVAFSEIEKFPSAVLKHHYPDVPNLGDFTKIDTTTLGRVDILAGGTPCFTAGHMVLSAKGYVPIEDIKVGDEVVTHKGRLRTVVRIGNERKDVGVMTGVGMREPITCTPDHPFLSVAWLNQSTKRNNEYVRIEHCGDPEWVAAKEMPGRQWCQLLSHDNDNRTPESVKFDVKTAMYVAGMYLGDGWIRKHDGKAKKSVVLGINPEKYVKLKATIGNAVHTVSHERTTVRVSIHDTAFADWLESEFAHYSHLKTVPSWVLGHRFRGEFLRGFLDTDGSVAKDGKVSISTTSRSLAYGISDLLAAEGYVSSVALVETPDTCVIEGRTCSQRDYYQVRAYPQSVSRKSRVRHGMMLRAVSDFTPAGEETVFNIEVEEDHSYVVQSAIVHNCQAFSVAGLRGGLNDERGNLTLKFVELAHELAANNGLRNAVWENVVGVLSDKGNAFGCFLAGLVGANAPIKPTGRWTSAGMVSGPRGRAAWRVLDAQYFGVAQRRRRVLVVADFGNGADPAKVLLIEQGLPRHPPSRGEAGKDVAPTISARTKGGGGLGTDFDLDGGLVEAAILRGHSDYGPGLPSVRAKGGDCAGGSEALVFNRQSNCEYHDEDIASTDSARDYKSPTDLVAHAIQAGALRTNPNTGPDGVGVQEGVAYTLEARAEVQAVCVTGDIAHTLKAEGADASEDGTGRGTPIVAQSVAIRGRDGGATAELGGDIATALRASQGGGDKPHVLAAVAFAENSRAEVRLEGGDGQTVGCIGAGGGKPGQGYPAVLTSAVRRLTPVECERLQGFPDGYTDIPWRGKPNSPDGPRYKALGNSWAVPKFVWLGKRIQQFMPALGAVANDNQETPIANAA
jgi:site-specific DNA-cytosine methylase